MAGRSRARERSGSSPRAPAVALALGAGAGPSAETRLASCRSDAQHEPPFAQHIHVGGEPGEERRRPIVDAAHERAKANCRAALRKAGERGPAFWATTHRMVDNPEAI